MNPLILICLISLPALLVARESEPKLSDVFPVAEAAHFVFVNETAFGEAFALEPKELKGRVSGELAEFLQGDAQKLPTVDVDYPFIGILARVMLLARDGSPLCVMQVVNWKRTVVFYGVTRTGGKYLVEERHALVQSEILSRWVYEQVRDHLPEEFARMQEMYSKNGQSIESLLFPD